MSEILKKFTDIIVDKLGVDEADVTLQSKFTDDLGCDSLDTVELVMACEKEFNISIPDEEAENMETVNDVVVFIEKNKK